MAGLWLGRPATEARSQLCLHYKPQTFPFLYDWPGSAFEMGVGRGTASSAKETRGVGTNWELMVPGGPVPPGKVVSLR